MKIAGVALSLVLVVSFSLPAAAGEETVELDAWYALYVGDAKVGWTWQRTVRFEAADGSKRWRSESGTYMLLTRGGQELKITEEGHTIEDAAGQILSFEKSQNMGMGPMQTTGRLVDAKFEITTAGQTQVVDYPAGAVGPVRVNTLLVAKGIREGTVLEGKVFVADLPTQAIDVKIEVGKQEEVDLFGRKKLLWRAKSTTSLLPNPEVVWMDESGETWSSVIEIPMLGKMRTVRTEKEVAQSDVQPTEVFFDSLIEPKGLIDAPRRLPRATYRLTGTDLDQAFVEGPGQRVTERGEGWAIVEVSVPLDPAAPFEPPFEMDASLAPYLKANALLELEDEKIRELAAGAPAAAGNAVDLARWIEEFVRGYIDNKSFGVGFGTAAEVARAREGDCTEHGVLCAALARALGLPSRVVVGLAYLDTSRSDKIEADGVFGYHMWTEVLVAADTWMPIDAALGGMDATHLAMGRSDLASVSPLADLLFPILGAMGDLEIEILEKVEALESGDASPGDG